MTAVGKKALLLGSGELGKEVAIELQRYGVEVVACDKYANAPAMQVAHRSHVFNMLDADTLGKVIREERPDHIIPEVEAIATPELLTLENEGFNVTPTAKAAWLTMNREGIRRLAAEELGITSSRRNRDTLRRETHHELVRTRTKHNKEQIRHRQRMENRTRRRTRRSGTRDCRRICQI